MSDLASKLVDAARTQFLKKLPKEILNDLSGEARQRIETALADVASLQAQALETPSQGAKIAEEMEYALSSIASGGALVALRVEKRIRSAVAGAVLSLVPVVGGVLDDALEALDSLIDRA